MIDKSVFDAELLNHDDDSTSNDVIAGSDQISITELLDTSMEDVRNTKNTLVLKMESVINLMKEVEYEEKVADQAKKEADQSSLDILVKLDECRRAMRDAEELNDTLVRKLYVHKAVLATKAEAFQLRISHVLDDVDRFSEVLDEMSRSLEMRLNSASMKKEVSVKKKQENEAFAEAALACEKLQMGKVEEDDGINNETNTKVMEQPTTPTEESRNLKQEAVETSKLLEFLMDHDHLLDKLHGEISDKCQNVKQLKAQLDQGIPLGGTLSTFASAISSCTIEGNKDTVYEADPSNTSQEDGPASSDASQPVDAGVDKLNKLPTLAKVGTFAKSMKKVNRKKNLRKRVKIKGLSKKTVVAVDERWDGSISEVAALVILLIMIMVSFV